MSSVTMLLMKMQTEFTVLIQNYASARSTNGSQRLHRY